MKFIRDPLLNFTTQQLKYFEVMIISKSRLDELSHAYQTFLFEISFYKINFKKNLRISLSLHKLSTLVKRGGYHLAKDASYTSGIIHRKIQKVHALNLKSPKRPGINKEKKIVFSRSPSLARRKKNKSAIR